MTTRASSSSRPNEKENGAESVICLSCNKPVRTKGIQYDLCAFWFCFKCSKLTDAMYKLLNEKEMPNIKWNYDGCLRVMPSLEGIQGS